MKKIFLLLYLLPSILIGQIGANQIKVDTITVTRNIKNQISATPVLASANAYTDSKISTYPLRNFSGSNFGAKLQAAITSVPSGSIIDCQYTTGIPLTITSSISVTKPLTILWGANRVTANVGAGNNVINIQSSSVKILGVSSSAKDADLNGQSAIIMTSGSWHIYSKGFNVLQLRDFDCIGIKSTPYQYEIGTTTLKTVNSFNNDGSGGICIIEGNPFVSGGGNSFSKVILDNIFIKDTRNSAIVMLGAVTTRIDNCRISGAAGHGVYIGSSSTTITAVNDYISSSMLAGFCIDGAATSAFTSCPVEASGMGMWLRSCQSVQVFGFYAEGNGTRNTGRLPSNTGLFFDNTEASATITVSDFATMLSGNNTLSLSNATSSTPLTLTADVSNSTPNHFACETSNAVTATNIAAAINASAGNTNYTASASGSKVRVAWNTLSAGVGNTFSCTGGTSTSSESLATGQILDDIGSDNTTLFKGTSLVITGGRNLYIPNPYSKDPGLNVEGASSTTRHYSIIGNVREVYMPNPACFKASSGYTGTPRFDIGIEASGTDIPRDVNLFFDPSKDGSVTPTIAGKYITQTNSSGESTVILDQGSNTLIQSGNDFWSYGKAYRTSTVADANYTTTANDRLIIISSLTAARTFTLLTPPSGGTVRYEFQDESGSASSIIKITLVAQSSKKINNASTYDIIVTPYGGGSVYYNGTNWFAHKY